MKKLLTIAAASIAFAAVAEYVPQQIGVTTIPATAKNMIIPVPFESLNGGAVSAKDLVKTTNLKANTWMLAFAGTTYSAWMLETANGQWTPAAIADSSALGITAKAAELQTLSAGSAIWIILPDDDRPDITVYGAYVANPSLTVTKGTTALVANPLQTGSKAPNITNGVKGDKLTVISGETFTTYSVNRDGDWGRWVENPPAMPTWTSGLPAISAGAGFWYKSTGETNVTISWE